MQTRFRAVIFTTFILATAVVAAGHALAKPPAGRTAMYEVTVTNLLPGQILSPITLFTHDATTEPLFTPGLPASPELSAIAEDADAAALTASLQGDPTVTDVQTVLGENGPILPGETAVMRISGNPRGGLLSLAGMLVTTNDGFIGLRGMALPKRRAVTRMVIAWDAGSEANTEACAHIPGPPCGSGGVRVSEGAEGFVHVHSGIHGVGDLDPATWDFNNPVARVTIARVR